MPVSELLKQLAERGLGLRRKDNDTIEVVGDATSLTPEMKTALRDHKTDLLAILPKPKDRPPWWNRHLSDADNQLLDDFLQYGPGGALSPKDDPAAWEDALVPLVDVIPCPQCTSLIAWWDCKGDQHCFRCDPPLKSIRASLRASELREKAEKQLQDDSIPMYGRQLPYRGRRQRAAFAGGRS